MAAVAVGSTHSFSPSVSLNNGQTHPSEFRFPQRQQEMCAQCNHGGWMCLLDSDRRSGACIWNSKMVFRDIQNWFAVWCEKVRVLVTAMELKCSMAVQYLPGKQCEVAFLAGAAGERRCACLTSPLRSLIRASCKTLIDLPTLNLPSTTHEMFLGSQRSWP